MKKIIFLFLLVFTISSCQQGKEADIDRDGTTDVIVKGKKLKDIDTSDNIFVMDGVVVNAVNNSQWRAKDGELEVIENPAFSLSFDSLSNTWKKKAIN